MKYIYIGGPYTAKGPPDQHYNEIDRNIARAREAFTTLALAGVGAFCPHLHSAHFEVITPNVEPSYWYELDLYFLDQCDAIYLLPGWENSTGTLAERNRMEFELHRPVFTNLYDCIAWALRSDGDELHEPPTAPEPSGPVQCHCAADPTSQHISSVQDKVYSAVDLPPAHAPHLRGYPPVEMGSNVLTLHTYAIQLDGERVWL